MAAPLYYESHITIEPVFGEELELVKKIGKENLFRTADLMIKKRKEDTPQRSQFDTFLTGRSSDYEDLHKRMLECVGALQFLEFKVWRYKIEAALIDVKLKEHEKQNTVTP